MIELERVTYRYDAQHAALEDVSLCIGEGEQVAVVGHNGSGKSTLAKHLNALLLPESGRVLVDGMDTKDPKNTLAIRQRVGMVFQNPDNQLVTTVVEEDVAFGPENLGVPGPQIRQRVEAARQRQRERYQEEGILFNAQLAGEQINRYCPLTARAQAMVKKAFETMYMSGRGYGRIRKVARTIADLAGEETIDAVHVAEAMQYRSLDKKYWGG